MDDSVIVAIISVVFAVLLFSAKLAMYKNSIATDKRRKEMLLLESSSPRLPVVRSVQADIMSGPQIRTRKIPGRGTRLELKHIQHGRCAYCKDDLSWDKADKKRIPSRPVAQVHHVIPYSRRGPDSMLNFVGACKDCNSKISNIVTFHAIEIAEVMGLTVRDERGFVVIYDDAKDEYLDFWMNNGFLKEPRPFWLIDKETGRPVLLEEFRSMKEYIQYLYWMRSTYASSDWRIAAKNERLKNKGNC